MKSREKIGLLQHWTGPGAHATGAFSCSGSAAGRSVMVDGCTSATIGTVATGNVALAHATASNETAFQKMITNLDPCDLLSFLFSLFSHAMFKCGAKFEHCNMGFPSNKTYNQNCSRQAEVNMYREIS